MKSKNVPSTEIDKIFLREYIQEHMTTESAEKIEVIRMRTFRQIWQEVSYSLSVQELRLDYHGANSKTCHTNLYNEYPLLRFDGHQMHMRYKIDQSSRKANFKIFSIEAKQFYTGRIDVAVSKPNIPLYKQNHAKKPYRPGNRMDDSIDPMLECMQRQDQIMGSHRRMDMSDTTDDQMDEFDGIDEMKVRGIDRAITATKKINKPTNKASFLTGSRGIIEDDHKPRHRFASA